MRDRILSKDHFENILLKNKKPAQLLAQVKGFMFI